MKLLTVMFHGLHEGSVRLGQLSYDKHLGYFEYDKTFLERGLEISPFALPSGTLLFEGESEPFNGLHGVFADSLPDGWGLKLMDRALTQAGIDVAGLTPLDRLAFVGDRAIGALSYEPDEGESIYGSKGELLDIDYLASEAIKVYTGEVDDVIEELADSSVSPQGARPKSLIALNGDQAVSGAHDAPEGFEHWLIKYPCSKSAEDRAEGSIEYLYSDMARGANIDFPDTLLKPSKDGQNAYFLTKRFDRLNNQRIHTHTLAGLVGANFRVSDYSYEQMLRVCKHLCHSHSEMLQLYKRMVFNVMAGNRDDHTKNFSFVMDHQGQWRNSQAYDITFNRGINGWHSMAIADAGRLVTGDNLRAVGRACGIPKNESYAAFDEVATALEQWFDEAPHYMIPKSKLVEISKHICDSRRLIMPKTFSVDDPGKLEPK
ncbi:type II toxin-antitoxin system HipA family toxin [Neptuniibacter sp. QD37_11]|uniref:type II toxin-antitoxin system HipA family toxin n=1 Tax=Neptuniibacter sp. QD37_11 TaxID=3398209 RepID=UPI0039F4EFEA